MSVQIDTTSGTCTAVIAGHTHRCAIIDARISTDPQARMSVLHIDGASIHVPEEQAEHLIGAGAKDDRANVIVDD